ncbi:hypothetical protein ANCDUO_11087, partial [Ancylostoma duodenale]
SLSEVDHSDAEEAEHEVRPPVKLTLKQQFLVCIGWADPKKYEKSDSNQIQAEEGHADGGDYSEEGEEEDDRRIMISMSYSFVDQSQRVVAGQPWHSCSVRPANHNDL